MALSSKTTNNLGADKEAQRNALDQKTIEREARLFGFRQAIGIPAIGIFANMAGFAAIAREAGFDITQSMVTTLFVWGMPGQVAMASLHLAGASALVIFTAVALANMRMMLMVVSGMEMMGLKEQGLPFWKKLAFMQMLAITSWVFIGAIDDKYSKPVLLKCYLAFASVIYISGLLGTWLGYYISDYVSVDVLRVILAITPLYILMMVANARQIPNRFAGMIGGILCPMSYPFIGEWSILLGGFVAGGLIVLNHRFRRHSAKEGM